MAHQRLKPESLLASPSSYQYGSVPSFDSQSEAPQGNDGLDNGIATSWLRNSNRSRSRRSCSRVAVLFGLSLLVGILLWIGTNHILLADLNLSFDNDDDDSFRYKSSLSLADVIPVPLLGSSKYRAQQEASHARDFLYLDPAHEHRRHRRQKPIEELLGSGRSTDTHNMIHAKEGCEATIMIMRHCEKGSIREHCDYLGYERSAYLASLFGKDGPWPAPSYVFAESPGQRRNPSKMNYRELETVLPVAEKFNLTVDTSYSTLDTNKLAQKVHGLLRSGEMCGKLMVISWKHSKLPRLAHALGCGPEDGCPMKYHGADFDELWQLKFVYRTPLHSSHRRLTEPRQKRWLVFGSLQKERFDPLAFSNEMGDYPKGGSDTGGRWMGLDHEIPERSIYDKKKSIKKHKKH